MGKLGIRLNSRKKAKRWLKGQSSSSNPQTVKHREQASWFFKDPTGINITNIKDSIFFYNFFFTFDTIKNVLIFSATEKPGITKEDLQKHDAVQGVKSPAETSENDNNSWETCTEDTANTFATNYSNCSNVSFSR